MIHISARLHHLRHLRTARHGKSVGSQHRSSRRQHTVSLITASGPRRRTGLLHSDDVDHSDVGVCGQQILRDRRKCTRDFALEMILAGVLSLEGVEDAVARCRWS